MEMETSEKVTSHGKTPSGESGNRVKGSPSHTKSHRSGEKKKLNRSKGPFERGIGLKETRSL